MVLKRGKTLKQKLSTLRGKKLENQGVFTEWVVKVKGEKGYIGQTGRILKC